MKYGTCSILDHVSVRSRLLLSFLGVIDEIILEARVAHKSDGTPYKRDGQFINGLTDHQLQLREHIKVYESEIVELKDIGEKHLQEVEFVNFPPGSVIAFKWVIIQDVVYVYAITWASCSLVHQGLKILLWPV